MRLPLDQIESQLQNLIEGSLAGLLPLGGRNNPLAGQMARALRGNATVKDGKRTVPGNYLFLCAPPQFAFWQAHPSELESLAGLLYQAGLQSGFRFESYPQLILLEEPALQDGETSIVAQPVEETGETSVMEPGREDTLPAEIPQNAFLIVNGVRMVPLTQMVVNLGRRETNTIVADDVRVSRAHAQMRAIRGVYYLFDLNSTGGTFVNGERISRAALKPGDVISLAGYPLIYSQDMLGDTGTARKKGGMQPGSTDELRPLEGRSG